MVESLLICVALLWIFKQVRAEERANPRVDMSGIDAAIERAGKALPIKPKPPKLAVPRAAAWALFIAICAGMIALSPPL